MIEVGDKVTWRHGKSKGGRNLPIGIAGCTVLELGEAEDGQPAAKLELPPFFGDFAKHNPDACNGYVADLEKE